MSEELKPCPSCKNPDVVVSRDMRVAIYCPICSMYGPCAPVNNEEYVIGQWNAIPRALEWTNEPPKVPGWYWFRNVSKPTILHIKRVPMERRPHPADEWAGPIPEPRGPK